MFGLRNAKMGKMKMGEEKILDDDERYSNEVKSFSHHLHQNYHHLLSNSNGFSCNSSEDASSSSLSSPSFTPFGVSDRFSSSLRFGSSNEGSIESDLSEMFYDKMHIGVDKYMSNNSFVHQKNQNVFGLYDDCFSDGVSGYNVDESCFGNVCNSGVYGVGEYSKSYDSFSHCNAVLSNPVYLKDHMGNLAGTRNVNENGYQELYSSMLQRMGGFVESNPTSMSRVKLNPSLSLGSERREGLGFEDSFILQGTNLNYIREKRPTRSRNRRKREKSVKQDVGFNLEGFCENDLNSRSFGLLRHSLMSEVQGFIYYMAKDQCGCRLLQRIFDEGSIQDVQIIFTEIIDQVIELMMDQFGNYFVQKLLEVCSEEQRMQIVVRVTEKPGVLISLCLNIHGTRAVQKLIETLKTRQQISLVIYALEPGFLDLITDVNGNHVVQRCLHSLSEDQNKFIFNGAAKFCVDIATHQHGCCVLNRCIARATGKDRENLVTEVIANGFHLAQDRFGNYVVQYIIELKIPYAAATLLSQFEGKYVYLSMQKFSSHVVEKCLKHLEQSRSRIVREFLSVPHFDQLLQDPFANYVVQSALGVIKGPLRAALVEAVEPHLILRTSPYCKKIFSRNLLKK